MKAQRILTILASVLQERLPVCNDPSAASRPCARSGRIHSDFPSNVQGRTACKRPSRSRGDIRGATAPSSLGTLPTSSPVWRPTGTGCPRSPGVPALGELTSVRQSLAWRPEEHTVQFSNFAPHGNFGPIIARYLASLDKLYTSHEQQIHTHTFGIKTWGRNRKIL